MSRFLKNIDDYTQDNAPGIDFDDAVRLPGGGTTCDIYRTRWQRREVFVKRLKEEFRDKPLYLDAFDKEYDIGVNLRHPSLPDYREFHRDYIVMDYIDGTTLAEMMDKHDPWLAQELNIVAMLKELVDVVDYLHRHNVVHCDIKPDNIMITTRGKNLVLIDFDKSYSDALSDTSGHPGKYGLPLEEAGNVLIDFHGIAKVVERLKAHVEGFRCGRYKQFVKACYSPEANCEALAKILDYSPSSSRRKTLSLIFALSAVVGLVLLFLYLNGSESATIAEADTLAVDAKKADADVQPAMPGQAEPGAESQVVVTDNDIYAVEKKKAQMLDPLIKPIFQEMHTALNEFLAARRTSGLTPDEVIAYLNEAVKTEKECIKATLDVIYESFPGTSEQEAWRILTFSKEFEEYMKRSSSELQACGLFSFNPYDKVRELSGANESVSQNKSSTFKYKSREELHAEAKKKAEIYDRRIQPMYDQLLAGHNNLMKLIDDASLTGQQMLDSMRRFGDVEDACFAQARKMLNETFPELTERERTRIMHYSKPYKEYMRRTEPEQREYAHEFERRFKKSGSAPQALVQ